MAQPLKFGSLFSGIGGFDTGFEQAGMECVWQVEIDKDCQRVLAKHWPDVARFDDVSKVGQLPAVDVICGGFPCQDLSVAGKRKGLAGERSGLWFEFLRIIDRNKPRWIVIENVPGLLSSDEGRDFAAILRGLVECGYCLAWRIVDAQYDGVAQRRRRVFIVGSLGDGSCAEILFESESVSWNPPTRGEARERVTNAISGGAHPGDHNGQDDMMVIPVAATLDQRGRGPTDAVMMNLQIAPKIAPSLTSRDRKSTREDIAEPAFVVTHALRSEGADVSEDGTGRGTPIIAAPITSAFAKHHGRTDGNNGGADNLIVANCFNGYTGGPDDNDAQGNHLVTAWALHSQNSCAMTGNGDAQAAIEVDRVRALDGGAGFTASQGGNLVQQNAGPTLAFTERTRAEGRTLESQDEIAYAVTNPGSGGRTHSRQIAGGFGVRRLTPRECERLQGFTDDFTRWDADGKEISDSSRYRMLGNAVCVNVAEWIGKRLTR
jgi:DNA (cytosine-5)-methyltransferase 1